MGTNWYNITGLGASLLQDGVDQVIESNTGTKL